MSMTSATPETSGQRSISSISAGPISAPASSRPGAEGTQDGAATSTRSGRPRAVSTAQRTPGTPSTFASSCGSQTAVSVPCGTTTEA